MDVLWPDFTPAHLDHAILEYLNRTGASAAFDTAGDIQRAICVCGRMEFL